MAKYKSIRFPETDKMEVEYFPGGMPVYRDSELDQLSERYCPAERDGETPGNRVDYNRRNGYDPDTAKMLETLIKLCRDHGRLYGVDIDWFNRLLGMQHMGKSSIKDTSTLPDVRIVEYHGRHVIFPTETMLDKFGLKAK